MVQLQHGISNWKSNFVALTKMPHHTHLQCRITHIAEGPFYFLYGMSMECEVMEHQSTSINVQSISSKHSLKANQLTSSSGGSSCSPAVQLGYFKSIMDRAFTSRILIHALWLLWNHMPSLQTDISDRAIRNRNVNSSNSISKKYWLVNSLTKRKFFLTPGALS